MTKAEFYQQSKQCIADQTATPLPKSDILQCGKMGGDCKLLKCVNYHNKS